MQIVAVTSSPRGGKSQTLRLVRALADGARKAGATVEIVDLCQLKMEYCRACDVCHRTGSCTHRDDIVPLRRKLLAADGIVFSSPDYFRSVTAQLKTLIDRMSDMIHCQMLEGKYACSIATAGGPAFAETTGYLDQILLGFGAYVVGNVGVAASQGAAAMTAAEEQAGLLGGQLVAAIKARTVYPDQQEQHQRMGGYFRKLVDLNKDRWPHEADVWRQKMTTAKAGPKT